MLVAEVTSQVPDARPAISSARWSSAHPTRSVEVGIVQTEDLLVGAQGDVALEFVDQIGPDRDGFLRFYAEEVLPKV